MHPPCLTPSDSSHFGCTEPYPPCPASQAAPMSAAMLEPAHRAAIPEPCWKPAPGPGAGAGAWGCTYLRKGKHVGSGSGCWRGRARRGIAPRSPEQSAKRQHFPQSRVDVVPVLPYSKVTENTKKSLQSYWSCQRSLTGRTMHLCSQLKTLFGGSNCLKANRKKIL